MRFSAAFIALAAPYLVSARPVRRAGSAADMTVLQFAHVLEQLETGFYQTALKKFQDQDFVNAGFASSQLVLEQLTTIQNDEATHTSVLEDTIKSMGGTPISSCQFNFGPALNDVPTMLAVARVVENVGVSAYLGAAHLIDDPVLLTAAASILTVEARHQTVLNILSASSTTIPAAFDIALSPSEVLAIAGQFISGCDLGVPANPALMLTNQGTVAVGTSLSFASPAMPSGMDTSNMFCQMLIGGNPFSIPLPLNNCVVPQGVNGPVAVFITSDGQPLANNIRDQATKTVVAGPLMAFIDSQSQLLTTMARSGNPSNASPASTTQTISPAQASSLLSSNAAQPTGGAQNNGGASGSAGPTGAAASAPASCDGCGKFPNQPLANGNSGSSKDNSVNVIGWQTPQAADPAAGSASAPPPTSSDPAASNPAPTTTSDPAPTSTSGGDITVAPPAAGSVIPLGGTEG